MGAREGASCAVGNMAAAVILGVAGFTTGELGFIGGGPATDERDR